MQHRIRLVTCHRRPDRSFFFRGRQFPVCARCTGILLGYLSFPLFLTGVLKLNLLLTILLLVPALIDGFTQAMGWRESNNWLRLFSGLLVGVSQVSLAQKAGLLLRSLVLNNLV